MRGLISRSRWTLGVGVTALLVMLGVWVIVSLPAASRFLLRFYENQEALQDILRVKDIWAPILFISLQALQVLVAPIPGEATGFLGGVVFGQWLGFLYSMVGLTAGSLVVFGVGGGSAGH